MSDYELEKICEQHPECDCNCMKCPFFAAYQRTELGMGEENEEEF